MHFVKWRRWVFFSGPLQLGEVDLVHPRPVNHAVEGDLGPDGLEEVSPLRLQTEMLGRRRRLDESRLDEPGEGGRSFRVPGSFPGRLVPAEPALLDVEENLEPVELLTKVSRTAMQILAHHTLPGSGIGQERTILPPPRSAAPSVFRAV